MFFVCREVRQGASSVSRQSFPFHRLNHLFIHTIIIESTYEIKILRPTTHQGDTDSRLSARLRSRGFGRRSRPWLVNGRDPRLSVGGIAPTGAYRSEIPRPQALKVIVYYKVRKTQRPKIANSAVWGLYILKSKCQRRDYSHMLSNYA
ncbi:unknown [Bacteroides sp. CAG:1060]|nr:unknown [Bacteroides sp. CAG:1060]